MWLFGTIAAIALPTLLLLESCCPPTFLGWFIQAPSNSLGSLSSSSPLHLAIFIDVGHCSLVDEWLNLGIRYFIIPHFLPANTKDSPIMALWWKLLSCYRCLAFHWNSRLHKVFSLLVAVAPLLFFKSFCIRDLWCDWKPFMIRLVMPYASLALMWKSFCWHFSANLNCQFLGSSFFSE